MDIKYQNKLSIAVLSFNITLLDHLNIHFFLNYFIVSSDQDYHFSEIDYNELGRR